MEIKDSHKKTSFRKLKKNNTWEEDEEIFNFGDFKVNFNENASLNFTNQDGETFEDAEEKPLWRLLGAIRLYSLSSRRFYVCTDARIIRLCVIWSWLGYNRKILKQVKNEENLFRLFLDNANKEKISNEEAQAWLNKNLIYFDPDQELFQNPKRQQYLYDLGTLIEEPKDWYFGK